MSKHNKSKAIGIFSAVTMAVLALLPGTAQAINLQQLFDGDSIAIGNTVFFDWQLDPASDASSGFEPDFTLIDVVPIQSNNLVGLQFNANDQWTTVGPTFIDTFFSYSVATTNPSVSIVASQLELVDFEFEDFGGAINIIDEQSDPSTNLIALNDVFADNAVGDASLLSSASFDPQSQIDVATSVLLQGDFNDDVVRLNSFEQRFTTVGAVAVRAVPEPATFGLFGVSALAIASAVRRRTDQPLSHS